MKKKKISKRISSQKKKIEKKPVKKVRLLKSVEKKKVKRGVKEKVNIDKSDDEFPGYPHYPSSKDIMNPKNKIVKEELTETSGKLIRPKSQRVIKEPIEEVMEGPIMSFEEENIEMITEADVTKDEKQLLEADELSEDMGEDEELRTRVWAVDMTGKDLDVPGSELDDELEESGTEDEENNIYSIGGDRHEGLEEEHDSGK